MSEAKPSLELLLRCPNCGGGVRISGESVDCHSCQSRFGVVPETGAPVLLPIDSPAVQGRPDDVRARAKRFAPTLVYKSPATRRLVADFVRGFTDDQVVVNIGAGSTSHGANVLNIDLEAWPTVHVVASAEALPLESTSCDAVVLQAVLEHVHDARVVLDELHRVLKPGGKVLVEVPFVQGYHAHPNDFRRYTETGLRAELEAHGFAVEDSGVVPGPASGMAWIAAEFLGLLFSGRSASLYRVTRLAGRLIAFPVKYADRWLEGHPMAHVIASGVWARGTRLP